MANFKVETLTSWGRLHSRHMCNEPRPHVVPMTTDAVDFVEDHTHTTSYRDRLLYGGFCDAISVLEDGRFAFRFKSLTEQESVLALDIAETALRLFLDRKCRAAHGG